MMNVSLRRVVRPVAWAVAVACASVAYAGPLGLDANGMAGFTGSAAFSSGDLQATLDYAVFAPGDFIGTDPSGGSEYVYAYQVFNTSTGRSVDTFSVGLLAGHGAGNAGAEPGYPQVGGVAPTLVTIGADSVVADLLTPAVAPGGFSQVVIFTSPNGPTFASASVRSGGVVAQEMAPTPVPEPATIGLLGLLGASLLRRRAY